MSLLNLCQRVIYMNISLLQVNLALRFVLMILILEQIFLIF